MDELRVAPSAFFNSAALRAAMTSSRVCHDHNEGGHQGEEDREDVDRYREPERQGTERAQE